MKKFNEAINNLDDTDILISQIKRMLTNSYNPLSKSFLILSKNVNSKNTEAFSLVCDKIVVYSDCIDTLNELKEYNKNREELLDDLRTELLDIYHDRNEYNKLEIMRALLSFLKKL